MTNTPHHPLVSIITLNWNQTDVTCAFLQSLKTLQYTNFEVLVCDMASTIDPAAQINQGNYPNTKVLVNEKNLGFAGGNNWGMTKAKGEFIFIVNNDTVVTPNLIDLLLEPFYIDESIGVVCPKICFFDEPKRIQYAGFNKMNLLTGRTTAIGNMQLDDGHYNKSGYTNAAHGCAMMVKKAVIEKVGMFEELFFLYYEESDWSSRIIKGGFNIFFQAKAIIYHKESMSVGKNNPMKIFYLTRNRILYMKRNSNYLQFVIFIVYFILFALPKNVFVFLLHKKISFLKAYLKGAWASITLKKYEAVY
jgi:GT2 family glycosyltransferase